MTRAVRLFSFSFSFFSLFCFLFSTSSSSLPAFSPAVCCNGGRRISTASCRSQWAAPGLNRELQIAVGSAGHQRGQRRNSTGELLSGAGSAGPWRPEKNAGRYVRKNVRRNARKNVRKYVRKEYQKICQKKCQKRTSREMSVKNVGRNFRKACRRRTPEEMSEKNVKRNGKKNFRKEYQKICQTER